MTDDWMADAACRGTNPDLFFPGRGESNTPALSRCRECPVTAECLAYALSLGREGYYGVWGGTSERQRRGMRRLRLRQRATQ